jgi:AAA15 family ATPase/GTPase
MLVYFAVSNFRSFKDKAVLDMRKTSAKGFSDNYQGDLLRSSVLYGANASGKSGFLRAFRALDFLVTNSADFRPKKEIPVYEPFLLDISNQQKQVEFETEFISLGVRYLYKIRFSSHQIDFEELFFYKGNSKALLFSREADADIKFGDYYKGAKKAIEKMLLPNQLFLSKAALNNVEVLSGAYYFFEEVLETVPVMDSDTEEDLKRFYARRLAEDEDGIFTKRFNALICALDTGIESVSVEEMDWGGIEFPSAMPDEVRGHIQEKFRYDIKTSHGLFHAGERVGSHTFEVKDESTGTKNLFALGGVIIEALENGTVLVVDELEKNLHPMITKFLIQIFHNPILNKNNAQLIFATHDVSQLSSEVFRRDQVWFSEKNEYGASELFRCSDMEGVRLNTPLDKWYISGRFGATPIINDVEFLIAMQD